MTCLVNGIFLLEDGTVAFSRVITFSPKTLNVVAISGNAIIPDTITVETDANGSASQVFQPGGYIGRTIVSDPVTGRRRSVAFNFNVQVGVATATWAECVAASNAPSGAQFPTTGLTGPLQAAQFPALTGDVTTNAGGLVTTLAPVSNAKLTTMPARTLKANLLDTVAAPTDANATGIRALLMIVDMDTRAALTAWAAAALAAGTLFAGLNARGGGLAYRYIASGTAISDMPGWVPVGDATPDHWKFNATQGVTDMTAAIVAADTWASANTKLLRFTGLYRCNGWHIKGGCRYVGSGPTTGLVGLTLAGDGTLSTPVVGCVTGENASYFSFENMLIDISQNTGTATTAGLMAMFFITCHHYTVDKCVFRGGGSAVANLACYDYRITNNIAHVETVYAPGGTVTAQADGCFDNWNGSHDFLIEGNTVYGNGLILYAILATGFYYAQPGSIPVPAPCYNFKIKNNTVHDPKSYGIFCDGRYGNNYDVVIEGNTVEGAGVDSIWVSNSYGVAILGNTSRDSQRNGIRVDGPPVTEAGVTNANYGSRSITLIGNVIENANLSGQVSINLGAGIFVNNNSQFVTIGPNTVRSGTGMVAAAPTHTWPVYVSGQDADESNVWVWGGSYQTGTSGDVLVEGIAVLSGGVWAKGNGVVQVSGQGLQIPVRTTAQRDAISGLSAGVELFNSSLGVKQLYNGSSWVALLSDANALTVSNKTLNTTNTVTLFDSLFTLQDDGDATKQAKFQLSSIPTATTVNVTIPGASGTMVLAGATQTLTNKTISAALLDVVGVSTETVQPRIGFGRSGDGESSISFVSDTTTVNGSSQIRRYGGVNGVFELRQKGTGSVQMVMEAASFFLISQNGAETLRITPAGDVGIGTNSPTAKLHVNGVIRGRTYTIGTLPAAGTVGTNSDTMVTDALAPTWNAAPVAGGSIEVKVAVANGSWKVH